MTKAPEHEIDPETLLRWEKYADDLEAEERNRRRRARDRYYFWQGVATSIIAAVVLMVAVWTVLGV